MKGSRLRWARVDDAQNIAVLELASAEYENRQMPLLFSAEDFTDIWVERIRSGQYQTLVCEKDGVLLGFLAFYHQLKRGEICCLYISPKYFRQGVGKKLMRAATLLVRKAHGKKLQVEVEVLNYGAQAFYRSLHFRSQSVKLTHLIVMIKEL